jgi:hypothetical protein
MAFDSLTMTSIFFSVCSKTNRRNKITSEQVATPCATPEIALD